MKTDGVLSFHIVDLPPEGVDCRGEVGFGALGIEPDEMMSFSTPLQFELNLAPVQDGVLVRGRLHGTLERLCDRCLAAGTVEVSVPDVCHHFEHAAGTVLDLTESVREDILLAFPQAWLCRADCRGLCARCGADLNRGACRCKASEVEPDGDDPWHVLDDLLGRRDG